MIAGSNNSRSHYRRNRARPRASDSLYARRLIYEVQIMVVGSHLELGRGAGGARARGFDHRDVLLDQGLGTHLQLQHRRLQPAEELLAEEEYLVYP